MAKISSFRVDSNAVEAGEWIQPGEEFDDLLLHVRGWNDAYYDAQAQRLRRAAIPHNGNMAKVSNAVQRAIRVECLIQHIVLGVKNLSTDAGEPVSFAQFCELLRNPDHGDLVLAVMQAAGMVGRGRAADTADAVKN